MVTAARDARPPEAPGADDHHPVDPLLDAHVHLRELARQRGDTVGLLDAKLGGVVDRGGPARDGRGDGEGGNFVDQPRHERAADARRAKVARLEGEARRGLGLVSGPGRYRLDTRAHRLEDDQDPRARRVHADPLHGHARVAHDRPGHEQERRRGDVAGDVHGGSVEVAGLERHRAAFHADPCAEPAKHPLGVVA